MNHSRKIKLRHWTWTPCPYDGERLANPFFYTAAYRSKGGGMGRVWHVLGFLMFFESGMMTGSGNN